MATKKIERDWQRDSAMVANRTAAALKKYPGLRALGVEWDDLYQELAVVWLRCRKKHDPERGKLTTLFYWACHNHVQKVLRSRIRDRSRPLSPEVVAQMRDAVAVEAWDPRDGQRGSSAGVSRLFSGLRGRVFAWDDARQVAAGTGV